jgi:hypothetical protein
MGNGKDAAKGRQMPVHYGSAKLNMVTISSPLSIYFIYFSNPSTTSFWRRLCI